MMKFRPSIKLSLVLLVLGLIFTGLGLWQLERKTEKEILVRQFEEAPVLSLTDALAQEELYARVEAHGHYDAKRHVLLDNRILNGKAGVHVLTPFILEDGRVILVNRGWLPLPPSRRPLPGIPTDSTRRTLNGILNRPTTDGPRVGKPDVLVANQWPQLVTYLELDAVGSALGTSLEPWLLQLDAADQSGFDDRHWKVAVMEPEVHGAYAVQWFGLALAALIIWMTLGFRRGQERAEKKSNGDPE